ncbi:MAG: hypothetical protein ABI123_04840 [Ginsengibacter sp.]|jgi:hypothetical protein
MFNPRDLFQKISYAQYPMMLIGLFYAFKPYVVGLDTIWENYNLAFIFMGLGISFSTLQDTTKTQNKISRKIWENPKKGKRVLVFLACMALFLILYGLYGIYISKSDALEQVSFGIIVFGIGLIGMLKAAMEMFENHRLDKNPPTKKSE